MRHLRIRIVQDGGVAGVLIALGYPSDHIFMDRETAVFVPVENEANDNAKHDHGSQN